MRIKQHKSHARPFSFGVDVWALGITLIELLIERRIVSELGAEANRNELDNYFRGRSQDADGADGADMTPFWSLARRMVAWDEGCRISAEGVDRELASQFPEQGRDVEELTPTPTKRRKHR